VLKTCFATENPSFVAESGVGRVVNFIKCQSWERKWKTLVECNFRTLRFSAIVYDTQFTVILFFCLFWTNVQSKRTTRAEPEDHLWSADHSLKNAVVWYSNVLYCTVLYCIVKNCIVLYCIVSHPTVLYCIVLYSIVLNWIDLYCILLILLYCSVLYCIVLPSIVVYSTYCTLMYYTVLYCNIM
jgi:hypothetical protein